MIENRQTARANGNTALEAQLNDSIKRLVKRDKKRWKLDLLEDFSTSKSKWSGIQLQKSDFKPTFYNLRDINGRKVPLDKKAETLAEYLELKQWAPVNDLQPTRDNLTPATISNPIFEVGSITLEETREAIQTLKSNKAPGPDGLVIELYKALDVDNFSTLARILNQMWSTEYYPDGFTDAQVVSLYKKGNPELPENYRPISLLI